MSDELIEFAKNAQFYQGDVITLGKMLPESDEELFDLMQQMIDQLEAETFSNLWLAAHWTKRPVPGSMLENGAAFLDNAVVICATAPLCARHETKDNAGETTMALLAAIESGKMGSARDLVALANAIRCWKIACGEDAPLPDAIGLEARKRAREYFSFGMSAEKFAQETGLRILAYLLDDQHIKEDLKEKGIPYDEKSAQRAIRDTIEISLAKLLPDRKPERVISGYQVRRAVPKTGRNDPCHCGSGKKYKKCCFNADQKKLSRSSEIEGITIDELDEQKEERLTPDEVNGMRPYELMRLDPTRINESVLLNIGRRLMLFDEFDHILKIYKATPFQDSPAWDVVFCDLLFYLSEKKRLDLIDEILSIKPELEADQGDIIKFVRADGDPVAFLGLLEQRCKEILALEEEEKRSTDLLELNGVGERARQQSTLDWTSLTFSMLESSYPHLAIGFARGVIPVASYDTETLLEAIENRRDSLGLEPGDFCDEIAQLCDDFDSKKWLEKMEQRIDEKHSNKLAEQTRKFKAKEKEYRKLQLSLSKSQNETARIEKQAAEKLAALENRREENKDSEKANDNTEIKELREQINRLKSEVKLKHNQRNELRRELRSSRNALEDLSNSPSDKKEEKREQEEETLLEQESYQPNGMHRIPVFPAKFLEDKKALPEHVVSAAIKLVGRLASGDESAFLGTKRLKSKREFLRQKVSSGYRLIFKIHDQKLEVVDLINRRDLEKWLG